MIDLPDSGTRGEPARLIPATTDSNKEECALYLNMRRKLGQNSSLKLSKSYCIDSHTLLTDASKALVDDTNALDSDTSKLGVPKFEVSTWLTQLSTLMGTECLMIKFEQRCRPL
ncbi:hypothetical protein [Salicola sp. Rm-C-2C1-2]|uniref:hypothetical protein n=1 Tax=Salicola sp. Rm-C-2C1-2 TaxID=3141321 RepID=UPI0032E50C3F